MQSSIILFKLLIILQLITIGMLLNCDQYVSPELKKEIKNYQPIANRIIHEIMNGKFQNFTYNELAEFGDKFGNRLAGTENLENSIDYMLNKLNDLKLDNVHGENVTVPYWFRGEEKVEMLQPRYQKITMLGLGGSVGTGPDGLIGNAIVFESFEDMAKHLNEVSGKIVVFNEKYVSYSETVRYRSSSASKAAAYGAVAVLIASVTPFSLDTPHTGNMNYDSKYKKIPAAAISPADANMLHRMQNRGTTIQLKIVMNAENRGNKISRNVFADITGREKIDDLVIVSGHIDSWDVGQGVMDDGAGAFIGWCALNVIKSLGLQARRTLRSIFWTGEEEGYYGAFSYYGKQDIDKINFIMESDEGTFRPIGFNFAGIPAAQCIFGEVQKLLEPIGVTGLKVYDEVGSDITIWTKVGVPGAAIDTLNSKYFWYHHSNADTMDVENSTELDLCTAAWAVTSFVIADLSVDMPRKLNPKILKMLHDKDHL